MTPRVSIIITAYKNEKFIAKAIESVLEQSFTDYEVIVCEDHGDDATYEVACKYSSDKVSVHRNEVNLGQHRNKNFGLACARGGLVKFLDGDDFLMPTGLETLVNLYDQFDGRAFGVFARASHVDENSRVSKIPPRWGKTGLFKGSAVLKHVAHIRGSGSRFGNVAGHIFNKKALTKVGGFPNANPYAGDWETFLKVLSVGNVVFSNKIVANYRHQSLGVSRTTPTISRVIDDFETFDRLQYFLTTHENLPSVFSDKTFYARWTARFLERHTFAQFTRMVLRKPNNFLAIKEEFKRRDKRGYLYESFYKDFAWYVYWTLATKIRIRIKRPFHKDLFSRLPESAVLERISENIEE